MGMRPFPLQALNLVPDGCSAGLGKHVLGSTLGSHTTSHHRACLLQAALCKVSMQRRALMDTRHLEWLGSCPPFRAGNGGNNGACTPPAFFTQQLAVLFQPDIIPPFPASCLFWRILLFSKNHFCSKRHSEEQEFKISHL